MAGQGDKGSAADAAGGAQEKAKRARKARAAVETSAATFDPAEFRSESDFKVFVEKFESRRILLGRTVNVDDFEANGLPLKEKLEKAGIFGVCTLNEKIYPRLVRIFYAQINDSSDSSISSVVKGVPIELNKENLSQILGFSSTGGTPEWKRNIVELGKELTGKDISDPKKKLTAMDLSAEQRVLHLISTHIILPRSGSHEQMSSDQMNFICSVMNGEQHNYGALILEEILRASKKIKAQKEGRRGKAQNLPYGMVLTKVFQHFKVNLKDEVGETLDCYSIISTASLKKAKFQLHKGKWVKMQEIPIEKEQQPKAKEAAMSKVRETAEENVTRAADEEEVVHSLAATQQIEDGTTEAAEQVGKTTATSIEVAVEERREEPVGEAPQDETRIVLEGLDGCNVPSLNILDEIDNEVLGVEHELNETNTPADIEETRSPAHGEQSYHEEPSALGLKVLLTSKGGMLTRMSIEHAFEPIIGTVQEASISDKMDKILEGINNLVARVEKIEGQKATAEGEPSSTKNVMDGELSRSKNVLDSILQKLDDLSKRIGVLEAQEKINEGQLAASLTEKMQSYLDNMLDWWTTRMAYPNKEHLAQMMEFHARVCDESMTHILQKTENLNDLCKEIAKNVLESRTGTTSTYREVKKSIFAEAPSTSGPAETAPSRADAEQAFHEPSQEAVKAVREAQTSKEAPGVQPIGILPEEEEPIAEKHDERVLVAPKTKMKKLSKRSIGSVKKKGWQRKKQKLDPETTTFREEIDGLMETQEGARIKKAWNMNCEDKNKQGQTPLTLKKFLNKIEDQANTEVQAFVEAQRDLAESSVQLIIHSSSQSVPTLQPEPKMDEPAVSDELIQLEMALQGALTLCAMYHKSEARGVHTGDGLQAEHAEAEVELRAKQAEAGGKLQVKILNLNHRLQQLKNPHKFPDRVIKKKDDH